MLELEKIQKEKDLAGAAKTLRSLGAPDCPVRQAGVWSTGRSWEFVDGVRLKFTGLSGGAPDCPVSQQSAGPTVSRANGRPRNLRGTRGRANGHKGAPDCPVCTGQCLVRQRL